MTAQRLDRFGRLLSACCAAHCLLMPVALVVFPLGLGSLLGDEGLHLSVIGLSLFVAGWSFWSGSRRHGRRVILVYAGIAAALVLTGELFLESRPWWHAAISASAGLALAWGHHLNLRWCEREGCDCPAHGGA
jgi:hypothetical protein